jgi:hypothetical protein
MKQLIKNKTWFVVLAFIMAIMVLIPVGMHDSYATTKVITSGEYKLTIDYSDTSLKTVVGKYEKTFKQTYAQMAKIYSPGRAPKEVSLKFEKNEKYPVAYAVGNVIYVNPDYAKKHPIDQGMLVHEMFHVVDAYPNGVSAPSWFREGMADYARFRTSNIEYWRLPAVKSSQKYTDSYGVTARFFTWINHIKYPGSLLKIHQRVQNNFYSDDLFKVYTGKTLSELWAEYQKSSNKVESLNWAFPNNKARYNGENGSGKWVKYFDLTYIPGPQNYIHTRSNNAKEGKVSYKLVNASTGKTVRIYTTSTLKQNSLSYFEPLSNYTGQPKKGKYKLYVQIPKGMNIDFEFNYGNKYY